MHEVHLQKDVRQFVKNLPQDKLERMLAEQADDSQELQFKHLYKEELAWCVERKLPGNCYMEWITVADMRCVFEFEKESDAMLFRLRWA